MAAPIFYSHWQLDILKAVLRLNSKLVARVARCSQYLQHVAKSSIRQAFCNIVRANLLQNLSLATRTIFWFHKPCNIKKKRCVASASKNIPRVRCTNTKFTSTAYHTCEMVKKREVVPTKVNSVYVMRFSTLQSSQFKNLIDIRLCVQFFAKLFPNIAIFH